MNSYTVDETINNILDSCPYKGYIVLVYKNALRIPETKYRYKCEKMSDGLPEEYRHKNVLSVYRDGRADGMDYYLVLDLLEE